MRFRGILTGVTALAALAAGPLTAHSTLVERTVFAEKFGYAA